MQTLRNSANQSPMSKAQYHMHFLPQQSAVFTVCWQSVSCSGIWTVICNPQYSWVSCSAAHEWPWESIVVLNTIIINYALGMNLELISPECHCNHSARYIFHLKLTTRNTNGQTFFCSNNKLVCFCCLTPQLKLFSWR